MNFTEAFELSYAKHGGNNLPWEISKDAYLVIFQQGWHAHAEAIKQTDLFPGSWDKDNLRPASLTGQKPDPCNVVTSVQVGCGADSVTAEDIYAAYPRKVGKQAALKAIKKASTMVRDGGAGAKEYLMDRTKAYAEAVSKWPVADKQFIPFPATWFNRGSYDDNPAEWSRGQATSQFSKTY
jgi:hypothetical protein